MRTSIARLAFGPRLPALRTGSPWIVLALVSAAACSGVDYDELDIECEGKCDGLDSIRALVHDAKKLDLQDLINVGAGYATDALNDALSAGSYASLQVQPTELYTTPAIAGGDLTLQNIDALVSGLATRFGDSALSTEVNQLRKAEIGAGRARVFADSAFRIRANLGHGWSLPARGFGGNGDRAVNLGFDAGVDLEARTVTAHASQNSGLVGAPLAAVRTARGFVIPRSIADVRSMKPGESFALSGRGRVGANLGAGVPILIVNPTSWLTYSLVITAGMRSVLEGQVDVQLVRLDGDTAVIDVGVQTASLSERSIALRDGFGIQGLIERTVNLAGISVDLGELLDKALDKRINEKLDLIEAAATRTRTSMRMSVARLRFSLDAAEPVGGREQALAQALRGDLRLAQALAARGDSGVVADFDMVRSGAAAMSYAGIDILGMSFYRRTASSEGTAAIQTPGGVLSLVWESLHREGGWFFTSHGFTRIGVAGLRFDGTSTTSETNLFLQTEEGDRFMERDKVIDQIDSVIVAAAGKDALAAIERRGNELERLILSRCPLPPSGEFFDEQCNIDLINSDPQVASLRAQALADLDAAIASLPSATRTLVHDIGVLRLAAQSIEDPNASAVGPTASMVVDFRLDDEALRQVMDHDRFAIKNAVLALMEATQLRRTGTDPTGDRAGIRERSTATAEAMGDAYVEHAEQYQRLVSIDGASIESLGEIGPTALEVRFSVDSRRRADYASAASQTIARSRAQVAGALFDALRGAAAQMPGSGGSRAPHPEQLASFAMLAIAPVAHTELRVNFDTDNGSCGVCGDRDRYDAAGFVSLDRFARGPEASPIADGLFDVDAIIEAPR
jgi:hypothetical protein